MRMIKYWIESILMGQVCSIRHVDNGEKAVEAFAGSKEGEYFAILMDIQMPVMNGYTATEQIRKLNRSDSKTVPIIAMTADAFVESVKRSQASGMSDYITKPINAERLQSTLIKYLKNIEKN